MRNRQVPYTELWKPDVNKNRDAKAGSSAPFDHSMSWPHGTLRCLDG